MSTDADGDAPDDFDWSHPIPIDDLAMETPRAQADYIDAIERARQKIVDRGGVVEREFVGYTDGAVYFVFFTEATFSDEARTYWVVMGDLPPAMIPARFAENAFQALNLYMGQMQAWVEAVREGRDVSDIAPVNAPPTLEYTDLLERRLKYMYEHTLKPNEHRL